MNRHLIQEQLARHSTRRPTLPKDYLDYDTHIDRWKIQKAFDDTYDRRFRWWDQWHKLGRQLLKGAE